MEIQRVERHLELRPYRTTPIVTEDTVQKYHRPQAPRVASRLDQLGLEAAVADIGNRTSVIGSVNRRGPALPGLR